MEMPLAAEGLRKLAMLAQLIATGSLLEKGYLFRGEPETNLNPKLIKEAALTILRLGVIDPAKVKQRLKQLLKAIGLHPKVVEIGRLEGVAWSVT